MFFIHSYFINVSIVFYFYFFLPTRVALVCLYSNTYIQNRLKENLCEINTYVENVIGPFFNVDSPKKKKKNQGHKYNLAMFSLLQMSGHAGGTSKYVRHLKKIKKMMYPDHNFSSVSKAGFRSTPCHLPLLSSIGKPPQKIIV